MVTTFYQCFQQRVQAALLDLDWGLCMHSGVGSHVANKLEK
jgi:hypothetical protein